MPVRRASESNKIWLTAWLVAAVLAAAVIIACATVPLTGRTQLNLVGDAELTKMSLTQYREVLSKSKLSDDPRKVGMIRRVGSRIAKATEEFLRENKMGAEIKNYAWEFNLIQDDKTINAWCMPGGKIAFYTGILPVCQDENGVAVVMGHEVAHALAKHGNERMSQALLVQLGGMALAVALSEKPAATQQIFMAAYGAGATVGLLLPYSRAHEYEADRIGLTLMAKAGYDPHAAVGLWERMRDLSKGKQAPAFLSTHPAPQDRIDGIKAYIPEAMKHYRG
ncbi:MAG: M48 family metallopeptidase [Thermodesulfobacteriota bacterium]